MLRHQHPIAAREWLECEAAVRYKILRVVLLGEPGDGRAGNHPAVGEFHHQPATAALRDDSAAFLLYGIINIGPEGGQF